MGCLSPQLRGRDIAVAVRREVILSPFRNHIEGICLQQILAVKNLASGKHRRIAGTMHRILPAPFLHEVDEHLQIQPERCSGTYRIFHILHRSSPKKYGYYILLFEEYQQGNTNIYRNFPRNLSSI